MAKEVFVTDSDGKVTNDLSTLAIPTIIFKSDLGTFRVRLDEVGGLEVEKTASHDPNKTNRVHICPLTTTHLLIT